MVGVTLAKVAAFVALMLVVGRRVIPWILHYVAHTGSRELFRLSVLAIALGVAFGASHLFGVSLALGAFFAGMIMSESELSHRAAEESLPLRDAFSVLFFVSVGMLFDPTSLLDQPWPMLATLFIIVIGKSVAAFLIVVAFRHPIGTALMISASLAQIGEFSFILAELGVGLNLLPEEGRDLILAGAILSIVLNPLIFAGCRTAEACCWRSATRPAQLPKPSRSGRRPKSARWRPRRRRLRRKNGRERSGADQAHRPHDPGRLRPGGQPRRRVAQGAEHALPGHRGRRQDDRPAQAEGIEIVTGNAANAEVFAAANAAGAQRLILAIPNAFEAGQIVLRARAANPGIDIIARAHSDAEVEHLTGLGANTVIMGEREIARGIVEEVLGGRPQPPLPGDQPDAPKPSEPPPRFLRKSLSRRSICRGSSSCAAAPAGRHRQAARCGVSTRSAPLPAAARRSRRFRRVATRVLPRPALPPADVRPPGDGAASPECQVPGSAATGTPSCAATMNSCQACAGRAPPVTFFIGAPSSLPNQTPVVRFAV